MKLCFHEQSGRSMVEILGVLAIIGVLSVGGIAGYSKAMTKINANKLLLEVNEIIRQADLLFEMNKKENYGDLNTAAAISIGMVPDYMIVDHKTLRSAVGGEVIIKSVDRRRTLAIIYNGLESSECVTLSTQDWGSGLQYIVVSPTGIIEPRNSPNNLDYGEFDARSLPLKLSDVTDLCRCHAEFKCGIAWFFR